MTRGAREGKRNHEISQTPHTRVLEIVFSKKKSTHHTHFHAFIEKNFQGGLKGMMEKEEKIKILNF